MRISVLVLSVIFGTVFSSAQSPSVCPTVAITGPAGVTQPGDRMVFTGGISGAVPEGVTYKWSLEDGGEIIDGQGTLRLTVLTPNKTSFNIVATLTLEGLPAGCINTVTETAPVACRCIAVLVDEFERSSVRDQVTHFENAATELRQAPDNRLFIIEYFPARTSERLIQRRLKWISDQLIKSGKFSPSDFKILISDSLDARHLTKIYRMPPGSEEPNP